MISHEICEQLDFVARHRNSPALRTM